MTQDEIIEMARQAELVYGSDTNVLGSVKRFANLVAQHEREACANACEEAKTNDWEGAVVCAAVIRARGQA
jgi:hypothetical protein